MSSTLGGSSHKAPFILCPAGLQQAVCCDYINHGDVRVPKYMRAGEFTIQHKGTLRWQSIHPMADGRPFLVQRRFTISSHPKATIRQFLGNWRGRPLTDAEADAFDLERLMGLNAMILVTHVNKPARGGVFQEVMMAAPCRGVPKLVVRDYIRKKDRPVPPPGQPAPASGPVPVDVAAGPAPDYPSEWDSLDVEPGQAPDQPNEDSEDWPI